MATKQDTIFLPPVSVDMIGTLQQLSDHIGWGERDLKLPTAWQDTQGEGVTVAILDSGASNHPDIGDNELIDLARSFIPNEKKIDLQGHGTHVAGIIAAKNNAQGVVGVAPKAKIIPLKVLNKYGQGDTKYLKQALEYCMRVKPDIINMSLGSYTRSKSLEPLYTKLVKEMNIPIVAASGNYGDRGVMFPAKYPHIISVGSYREGRKISDFSSFQKGLVDFAAPGEGILSTFLKGEYAVLSGTSMASPFFCAILVLLISKFKEEGIKYTVDSLRELLRDNSIDVGAKGRDAHFGNGIVDVNKALQAIEDGTMEDDSNPGDKGGSPQRPPKPQRSRRKWRDRLSKFLNRLKWW